ncbi:FAD-binding oxidoreductase [Streptoalloteichus tenebrarius]|uniref:FAD-binding oxidoreductase n=1 Tax=Streptoalloteichus tenebrarius (strain ATCC 17920 / DSM 40477 / JCM 4838 / CBS 697.72 / NBRC 16177 / NCIMB 11028 / NRRL B-12390 / A12253. 1 / ISP 5477) TaxID=1933 RepID=UPI0020A521E0|nr:FAD-linked oxidase C-terminal domain-containing protein [Streptoalloteichus tenebrarius]BFF02216.1 FAD-linked oxidase C-terminal domain-containing protein [Streptoalloteichus tenebrarius]
MSTTLSDHLVAELRAALGPEGVLDDPDVLASYRRDMMPLAPAGVPRAVALPADADQVRAVVRACAAAGAPIVPRGAGSGLSGAANAVDGCVVLATTRMNRILEIDPDNRLAVVEPGVVNLDLRHAVEKHGLFYPPDPSSYDWCTIGGNLSTNAGGLCCVKYGVTTDSVLGLDVVLADGSLLRTGRRTVKGVAGYDLTRLFVGAEGTLGVITSATLALRPLPQAPATLVAAFGSTAAAASAVTRIVRAGLIPSLMEIMDRASILAVERNLKTELGAGGGSAALLLCQSDSGGEAARREIAAIERICADAGSELVHWTADLAEGRMLMAARRAVLPSLEVYGSWLTDDVCVPRTRIADLINGCEAVGERHGLLVAVVGHAGDGNMHPTIVYDPESEEQFARARRAFDEILELGLSLGGTITGEHGVGKIKREWLEREIGPVGLGVHRAIKAALDPGNLFNPGSMFAAE